MLQYLIPSKNGRKVGKITFFLRAQQGLKLSRYDISLEHFWQMTVRPIEIEIMQSKLNAAWEHGRCSDQRFVIIGNRSWCGPWLSWTYYHERQMG